MIWKSNNLKELRNLYIAELSNLYGRAESKQLVHMLMDHLFGITQIQLAMEPEKRLNESEMLQLHKAVNELLTHKPVQYVTGHTTFLGMKLAVNESVLIPRPETEELVQLILNRERAHKLEVIDIGTGSGCIALALKKQMATAHVTAMDISAQALELAHKNSRKHKLDIELIQADILHPETSTSFLHYDLVVSNPPYVMQSDKKKMRANVLHYEPGAALFVEDNNPLIFYKAILRFSASHLKKQGRIYFELHERKGHSVVSLLEKHHYKNIMLHKDMNGKYRFVEATKG